MRSENEAKHVTSESNNGTNVKKEKKMRKNDEWTDYWIEKEKREINIMWAFDRDEQLEKNERKTWYLSLLLRHWQEREKIMTWPYFRDEQHNRREKRKTDRKYDPWKQNSLSNLISLTLNPHRRPTRVNWVTWYYLDSQVLKAHDVWRVLVWICRESFSVHVCV